MCSTLSPVASNDVYEQKAVIQRQPLIGCDMPINVRDIRGSVAMRYQDFVTAGESDESTWANASDASFKFGLNDATLLQQRKTLNSSRSFFYSI